MRLPGCCLLMLTTALASPALAQRQIPQFQPSAAWQAASAHIKHVIIIMQENRSFDTYFGTYPGADGLPPNVCVPLDTKHPQKGCVKPFHDPHDVNAGGPHSPNSSQVDLDDGITTAKLDGFVTKQSEKHGRCTQPDNPTCTGIYDGILRHDVMGYHDATEIPNYWTYAQNFVLQDRLFEGVRSWSFSSHLDLGSEWVASCTDPLDAKTCKTAATLPFPDKKTVFPWVNLWQLLEVNHVSWKWYLGTGNEPDCEDDEMTCDPQALQTNVPSIWNPAPFFSSVIAHGPEYLKEHNPRIDQFLVDLKSNQLPKVSWIVPSHALSEHPSAGITAGMEYVTSLVNAVMQSPYWSDTAIFISWDDWGGFYDHVVPPNVDRNDSPTPIQGFGLRVPGIMISAYAKQGMIDHALYSFDNYATFFENLFANGARLDPTALGNPDARPDIRDALTQVTFLDGSTEKVGDMIKEFDFDQAPRKPVILSTHIPTGIAINCTGKPNDTNEACTQSKVTVSWQPVADAQVPGPFTYHVTRDGMELPQCIGTAISCTDTPGTGTHLYRAFSVDQNGVVSPTSGAAEADEP